MMAKAKTCVFSPSLMLDIKNLWEGCLTCQTVRRAHNPSIPLNEDMSNHQVMEVLSADLGQLGSTYYLIIVDKCSAYVWCQHFGEQSTSNSIKMLQGIFNQFGKPKELVTDSGPAFRSTFQNFCQENFIDHKLSAAFQPWTNG